MRDTVGAAPPEEATPGAGWGRLASAAARLPWMATRSSSCFAEVLASITAEKELPIRRPTSLRSSPVQLPGDLLVGWPMAFHPELSQTHCPSAETMAPLASLRAIQNSLADPRTTSPWTPRH